MLIADVARVNETQTRGHMLKDRFLSSATAVAFSVGLALGTPAHAGLITTFSGQDDGSAIGLPLASYLNSNAAFQSFLSTLLTYGWEDRHGLGNIINTFPSGGNGNGFHDIVWNFNGYTGDLNYVATTPNLGSTYSGVNTTTLGNLYGFGVGTGNTAWLGIPEGSATFSFVNPTNAFGFWLTGLQGSTFGTVITIALTDSDGAQHVLNPTPNDQGGAQFYGFSDTATFTSLTVASTVGDAWGIDNISFNVPNAVPLPATLPLFATGLGAMGLLGWRRKRKNAAALAA